MAIKTFGALLSHVRNTLGEPFLCQTDRGQGIAGPCLLASDDTEWEAINAPLCEVSEEEDPEAWELARKALGGDGVEPSGVWVGRRGPGSNPYQAIYTI